MLPHNGNKEAIVTRPKGRSGNGEILCPAKQPGTIAFGNFRRLDRSAKRGAERPSLCNKQPTVGGRSLRSALRASVETTRPIKGDGPDPAASVNEATPAARPRSTVGVFTVWRFALVLSEKLGAHRRWMIGAGLLLVVLAGYFGWHGWQAHEAAVKQAQKPPTAIPVKVVTVRTADFPVYLKGLGTVQPFDTVTVKSRVDGQVVKVAFKQGDMVKEGDILIADRPEALPGGARPGVGQEGAGRGQPQERGDEPRALRRPGEARLRVSPAGRHPAGHGRPARPPRSRATRR